MSLSPCTVNIDPSDISGFDNAITTLPTGSVICLNAGTAFWDALQEDPSGNGPHGVKHLEIRGAGTMPEVGSAGETIITIGSGPAFAGKEGPDGNVIISNIRFIFPTTSSFNPANEGIIGWGPTSGGKPWIIHHNDFIIEPADCGTAIVCLNMASPGIVYRNYFHNVPVENCSGGSNHWTTTNQEVIDWKITDPSGTDWATASTFGTADTTGARNAYFEDNEFHNFAVALNRSGSSRTVFRFNKLYSASITDHGFDTSPQGDRHSEVYNNQFICDPLQTIQLSSWDSTRGGSHYVFNNTFDVATADTCGYPNGDIPNVKIDQMKLQEGVNVSTWPGAYPDTYPVAHQIGWGYITGATNVGSSTKQGDPGGAGFDQDLEPHYYINNRGNDTDTLSINHGYINDAPIITTSIASKSSETSLAAPVMYVSSGEDIVAVFADRIGGSAPTISDSESLTWTALQGGTNGSIRLSAWRARATSSSMMTVTFHFPSSGSAAHAGTVMAFRNLATSPIDKNPTAANFTSQSTINAPATGTLSAPCTDGSFSNTNDCEVIIGYYAIDGPTTLTGLGTWGSDELVPSNSYRVPWTQYVSIGNTGINGTTGGSDITVAAIYKYATSTATDTPQLLDNTTTRSGVAGTLSLKQNGDPQLETQEFFAANREYYDQQNWSSPCQTSSSSPFNGTSGTGCGTRALRPSTCTAGVGYWSFDAGTWNTTNNPQNATVFGGTTRYNGVLDKCTATNSWHDAWYVPKDYPHPLATEIGSGAVSAAPVVSLDTPAVGATVSGSSVSIQGSATSDASIASMALKIDGTQVATSGSSPVTYSWNSNNSKIGRHTITVTATDTNGLTTSHDYTILHGKKGRGFLGVR